MCRKRRLSPYRRRWSGKTSSENSLILEMILNHFEPQFNTFFVRFLAVALSRAFLARASAKSLNASRIFVCV